MQNIWKTNLYYLFMNIKIQEDTNKLFFEWNTQA